MQTFLPDSSFVRTAQLLDRQRLGKQRVEAWQILRALLGETKGWTTHPATLMWRGYEAALLIYAIAMCDEWISRGYVDNMRPRFVSLADDLVLAGMPHWLGDPDLHASHRSNLLRKAPEFYSRYGWNESDDLPYVWPTPLTPTP